MKFVMLCGLIVAALFGFAVSGNAAMPILNGSFTGSHQAVFGGGFNPDHIHLAASKKTKAKKKPKPKKVTKKCPSGTYGSYPNCKKKTVKKTAPAPKPTAVSTRPSTAKQTPKVAAKTPPRNASGQFVSTKPQAKPASKPVSKPYVRRKADPQKARQQQAAAAKQLKSKDAEIARLRAQNARQKTDIRAQQAANQRKAQELRNNRSEMDRLRKQRNTAQWREQQERYRRYRAEDTYGSRYATNYRRNNIWDDDVSVWSHRPGMYTPNYGRFGYGRSAYGPVVSSDMVVGALAGGAVMAMINRSSHANEYDAANYGNDEPQTIVAPAGTELVTGDDGTISMLSMNTDGEYVETALPMDAEIEMGEEESTITTAQGQTIVIPMGNSSYMPADGDEGAGIVQLNMATADDGGVEINNEASTETLDMGDDTEDTGGGVVQEETTTSTWSMN